MCEPLSESLSKDMTKFTNITLQHITREQAIINLMTHDSMYKALCLDSPEQVMDTNLSFYAICLDSIPIGFMAFKPYTINYTEFHGGLYKKYRHNNTIEMFKQCLDQYRKEHHTTFITCIPSTNKAVIQVVLKAGFKHKTTLYSAFENVDLEIYAEK